jgi:hypothetical protein
MAKIGVIGGGVGLAVFLYKRQSSGGGGGGSNNASYGLPNTAIMLGSLQQGQLDIKGQIGSSAADLSNQMASDTSQITDTIIGGNETLGQMFDMLSASLGQSFSNLQSNLIDNNTSNTNTIIAAVGAGSAAVLSDLDKSNGLLAQLIQGNTNAINAVGASIQDSISKGFDAVTANQNATAAAIGALGSNVTAGQKNIIDQITGLQTSDANIMGAIGGIKTGNATSFDWNMLNGKKLWSTVDNGWYTVQDGIVKQVDFWDTVPGKGRPFGSDVVPTINVNYSLLPLSHGFYVAPN